MPWTATRWSDLCASSSSLRFVDANLRGVGQVLFQDHPLSGALFLAALAWGTVAADVPHVAIGGVTALVAATATARVLRADATLLATGRYGYNGILTGLALSYYLGPGLPSLTCSAFGGVLTAIAMLGPADAARPWSVPAHTYPFVLTVWIMMLAAQGFDAFPDGLRSTNDAVALDPAISNPMQVGDFLLGAFHSVSQIFFKSDAVSALLILAGLAVGSLAAAAFAAVGAVVAILAAHAFGVESELITDGVQGFSPVLAAVAFGTVFHRPSVGVAAYAVLAALFTVVVHWAFAIALAPLGLPPLSAPFDLAAWMMFRLRR